MEKKDSTVNFLKKIPYTVTRGVQNKAVAGLLMQCYLSLSVIK